MAKLFNQILTSIDGFVWGVPLIVLILAVGVFLTIRVKGLQIRLLPRAIKELFVNEKSGDSGEVSSFAALCTALSATIGTGNIVGVATALVAGGPGALFWMWVAAFVGMATKYSECLLSVKYRTVAEDGHIVGGPFYYCLLYTSDAADEEDSGDLGGRRIIKKKNIITVRKSRKTLL